jgi:hypothetical protein
VTLGGGHADGPRRAREVLEAAGYRDKDIVELLDAEELTALGAKRLQPLLRRTSGGTPLETLVRLFILGVAEDAGAVARAVSPMSVSDWMELGLLAEDGGAVRATVQVRRYQDLVVAFDFNRPDANVPPDYVMGISPSSLSLAGLTVRRRVGAALDLGTGSGFQALLAAAHSQEVVATDRNPRAVEMATFNARLNGLANVTVVEGDLFDPVAGRGFDLIVSNPPFIISPDSEHLFLYSGHGGDEGCRRIVAEAPYFLAEGGLCQLLANWALRKGEDWVERPRQWAEGTGCDVWVLRRATHRVDEYAATWIERDDRSADGYARAFAEWMDYYDREGIECIVSGVISMRRRPTGAPWFWADDAPASMSFPCGDDVAAGFDRRDVLAELADDGALLAARLKLSDDVCLHQQLRPGDGAWEVVSAEVRRSNGLEYAGSIDSDGARLLAGCDGRRPLGDLVAELAASVGADAAEVTPAAVGIVRRLIAQGFLGR